MRSRFSIAVLFPLYVLPVAAQVEEISEYSFWTAAVAAAEETLEQLCPDENDQLNSRPYLWTPPGEPETALSYWQLIEFGMTKQNLSQEPAIDLEGLRKAMNDPSFGYEMAFTLLTSSFIGNNIAVMKALYDAEPLETVDWKGTLVLRDVYLCLSAAEEYELSSSAQKGREMGDNCIYPTLENVIAHFDEAGLAGTDHLTKDERLVLRDLLADSDPLFPGTPGGEACSKRQI